MRGRKLVHDLDEANETFMKKSDDLDNKDAKKSQKIGIVNNNKKKFNITMRLIIKMKKIK